MVADIEISESASETCPKFWETYPCQKRLSYGPAISSKLKEGTEEGTKENHPVKIKLNAMGSLYNQ